MPAKKRSRSNSKQVYIICAIVTLAVLGVIFGIHEYKIAQIAPVYQIRVDGLDAATPAEAQAACARHIRALPSRARNTRAALGCGQEKRRFTSSNPKRWRSTLPPKRPGLRP